MKKIKEMNYSEFVGLINERNRPSGGIKTIQEIIVNARLDEKNKILEIGSNTGFTTVNIGLLTNAKVIGIDVNEPSIEKSKLYANKMGAKTVDFIKGTALELLFEDESFDLIWCSNVASFIDDKKQAISEYLRVLKPNGFLAVIPIYYRNSPPQNIVDEISKAIDCKIEIWDKKFWVDLFKRIGDEKKNYLEIIYEKDYRYLDQKDRLDDYIENILSKNLDSSIMESEEFDLIKEHARYFYKLFNENNYKYAGYSTILMQKRKMPDEEELFLSEEI